MMFFQIKQILLGFVLLSFIPFHLMAQQTTPTSSTPTSQPTPTTPTPPKNQLTKSPELIEFIEAEYPAEAKAKNVQASVVLLITISEKGDVTNVAVQESSKSPYAFDQNAMKAVQAFKFKPAEIDHQPAPVQIAFKYDFTIQEEKVQVEEKRLTGKLSGTILEKGTRRELSGIKVKILGQNLETFTDQNGKFLIDLVEPGKVKIEISDQAFYGIEDFETVEASKETNVLYYIEAKVGGDANSITVVGRKVRKEVAKRTLTVDEIRRLPGTQGDAIKVIQNLPGVARTPFGGAGLIVRGNNPRNSGIALNRHFIPVAFHFGGIRSIFPSELLENLSFYPGNFSSEYGRYSGGIVDVKLKRPSSDKKFHGRFEADIFDAGVFLEGPLTENSTFAIAGRRSYIDAIIPAILPSSANIDFTVAPRYYDYQIFYDYKKGKNRIRAYYFGSDDQLRFLLDKPTGSDPSIRGTFKTGTGLSRFYLAWDHQISSGLSHHTSVSSGQNNLLFSGFGSLLFDNKVNVVSFRDDITWKKSDDFTLRGGLDAEAFLGNINFSLPAPQQEGQVRGDTPLGTSNLIRGSKQFNLYNPGLWIEAQWRVTPNFLFVPGVRFDYDVALNDFTPDPRFNGRYELGKQTTLKGGIGRYSQRPQPEQSDSSFGNPKIKTEHSMHSSFGFEHDFNEWLELDMLGFYNHFYSSVSPSPNPQVRYDNNGSGRSYGLETLLRINQTGRFFGWLSYTLMRSERMDSGSDQYRLFDFDQTHILTLIGQYQFTQQWAFGFRWRYVTGLPYTPYTGAIYDSDASTYVPTTGAVNSARNKAFQQLDIRIDRRWVYQTWRLNLYFEIQNALNRSNPEGLRYNYNYTQQTQISSLPIIPSLGIRGEF
jgi:TonB family protein